MAVPVVAIVGRPNVGKSSVFNWLAGRRIAIVEPTAGVTRDRVSTLLQVGDRFIEVVDTGGMGHHDVDNLSEHVERQIETAIDQAHLVLFVVDGRTGIMPLDDEVARRLRYVTKPILCVANKCDTADFDPQTAEFYKLGRGKLVCVSALQNRNRDELLELILQRLPPPEAVEEAPRDPALKLAIVGRRNTGKSTFINSLAETERMIVSETPGTTRDSVDVRFERDGLQFIAIDTAGVRKERSLANAIEFYSQARAERSIRRADVVLLFLDPQVRVSKVDKQLADYILEQHTPAIFVVNKWDLMIPMRTGRMAEYIRKTFPNLDYVPIAFITAKAGKNVHATLNLAQNLHKQASRRVTTGELNRALRQAMEATPPPLRQNRRPKIYYASQVSTNPPTIVLFTNGPELFDVTYQRYLIKMFRDQLGFSDVPIKLYLRRKNREDQPNAEERAEERARLMGHRKSKDKDKERARKPKADAAKLPFKTKVTDEETRRDGNPYESELWTDL